MNLFSLVALILSLSFSSCSSVSTVKQDLKVERRYKRDLSLSVNQIAGKGFVVAPKTHLYTIAIKAPDKMDALLIQTCHREMLIEGLGTSYQFAFWPVQGLEDEGSCPMFISGLTKDKERIALGLVDFYSGQELPATIHCSGETMKSQGVSVCQAPSGLWQEMIFDEEVRYIEPTGKCTTQVKLEGKKVKYRMPLADCVMLFVGKESGKLHKANWLGFEDYVLREQ